MVRVSGAEIFPVDIRMVKISSYDDIHVLIIGGFTDIGCQKIEELVSVFHWCVRWSVDTGDNGITRLDCTDTGLAVELVVGFFAGYWQVVVDI